MSGHCGTIAQHCSGPFVATCVEAIHPQAFGAFQEGLRRRGVATEAPLLSTPTINAQPLGHIGELFRDGKAELHLHKPYKFMYAV